MTSGHWTSSRIGADAGSADPGVTVYELDSGLPGPTVLIIGGIHGNEVGGVVAAGSLTQSPWPMLRGRVIVAPIAHEAAWNADQRESPFDGENLARVFPGDETGSVTQKIAYLITTHLISVADVLIDLHTSSPDTEMPLFAGCLDDGSPAATRAVELTVAFGAPTIWTHDTLGPGRTLGVARDRGIPAIYVESSAGGVLATANLAAYRDGVFRVLAALGVVAAQNEDQTPRDALWIHGDGDVDAFSNAAHDGLFVTENRLLDSVFSGDTIGHVVDEFGRVLETVTASASGLIATIRRHSRVSAGTPLVGVVPQRRDRLGKASDAIAANVAARAELTREKVSER
ncbi:succinylglutamate desuccinylase/aspartoacylase family protein [Salinibacterium sp. M195]|uniref:succinylglutamate desuccinylase/aspartoacylase family protein n=1 Tax=Salinibacterium sp. M195 TaxID=2583374 RepID=UPI001C63AA13|nr:M14 family metallopeptidase [Salinibacterium sp. M195]QYH35274.1 hypothetical protein FFT87_04535 [Salinibacterium sp. M195]